MSYFPWYLVMLIGAGRRNSPILEMTQTRKVQFNMVNYCLQKATRCYHHRILTPIWLIAACLFTAELQDNQSIPCTPSALSITGHVKVPPTVLAL